MVPQKGQKSTKRLNIAAMNKYFILLNYFNIKLYQRIETRPKNV